MLARSARLPLFLMLRYEASAGTAAGALARHLTWMIENERAGRIFLSGPVAPTPEGPVGATVIRAATREAAEAIAGQDPFVTEGYVRFTLHAWTVYEGCLPFTVRLSDSSVSLG